MIRKFQRYLRQHDIDAALIKNLTEEADPTLRYLIRYDGVGKLFIPKKGKPTLFVSALELARAKKVRGIKVAEDDGFLRSLPKNVGIEYPKWTLSDHEAAKLRSPFDISQYFLHERLIKSNEELRLLKRAGSYTAKIFDKLSYEIKDFTYESDVAAWIDYEIRKRGCEPAFPTIVASGKNSAMPHYAPQKVKLQKGFTVIDCGARCEGYGADMTRTLFKGKPLNKEVRQYAKVREVLENTQSVARPNLEVAELDKRAMRLFGKESKYFVHALGHGIGLQVHEAPFIHPKRNCTLKKGMVFTLEPGLYYKSGGVRIEDDFVVVKDGVKCITPFTRDLLCY